MNPLHKHKVMSVGYQVKQNLKSRCCGKLRKSGLEIDPATGEHRSQDRMCSKTKSIDSAES